MIGMIICWWTQEHNWSKWSGQRYTDGRTWYWMRICRRCKKIESVLDKPEVSNEELCDLAHTVLQNVGDKEI